MFLTGQEIKNPLASERASVFDLLALVSQDACVMLQKAGTERLGEYIRRKRRIMICQW